MVNKKFFFFLLPVGKAKIERDFPRLQFSYRSFTN